MNTTNKQTLGNVSLYHLPEYTQEEQAQIDNYNKILWFQKQLEKDIDKQVNGGVNQKGERIDSNTLIYEQIINVEMFASNAIAKDFGFDYADIIKEESKDGKPIGKFQNKKILNKGAQFQLTSSFSLDAFKGPLEKVQADFVQKQIDANKKIIDKYTKQTQKNLSGSAFYNQKKTQRTLENILL